MYTNKNINYYDTKYIFRIIYPKNLLIKKKENNFLLLFVKKLNQLK